MLKQDWTFDAKARLECVVNLSIFNIFISFDVFIIQNNDDYDVNENMFVSSNLGLKRMIRKLTSKTTTSSSFDSSENYLRLNQESSNISLTRMLLFI